MLKNIKLGIVLLSFITFFYSCTSNSTSTVSKDTLDQTQVYLDSIGKLNTLLENCPQVAQIPPSLQTADATAMINMYHGIPINQNLKIPIALMFSTDGLKNLSNNYPYIRFYFTTSRASTPADRIISLVAVGVKSTVNVDDITPDPNTGMYDFAEPCPICSTSAGNIQPSLLYPVSTLPTIGGVTINGYLFKKLGNY